MTVTTIRPHRRRTKKQLAHIAALAALPNRTERIRYACAHQDGPPVVQLVRIWLAEHGVAEDPNDAKSRPFVSKVVNEWRRAHDLNLSDTGEIPIVTDAKTKPAPKTDAGSDVRRTRPRSSTATPGVTLPVTSGVHSADPDPAPEVYAEVDAEVDAGSDVTLPVTSGVHLADSEVYAVKPVTSNDARATGVSARTELIGNAALVVPLLLVNTVAVYGQVQWAHEHLTPGSKFWFVAVGFALAVESIGVYLAAEAHRALLAGDASLRLRLGSYAVGALAGALNYAHFAPEMDAPNTQAIVFGVLSAISPVLWAIRSRSISRDRLRALELIDGRAVKFTAAQWLLYPRRSAVQFRLAVWAGETNPTRARALVATTPNGAAPTL